MARGATLTHPLELTLLVQRGLTVAISGHNAFYFAQYRLRHGKRRLGAAVLVFINLAIGGESLAFGLLPWAFDGGYGGWTMGGRLVAASLSLAVVVAIAVLILRQRIRRR